MTLNSPQSCHSLHMAQKVVQVDGRHPQGKGEGYQSEEMQHMQLQM